MRALGIAAAAALSCTSVHAQAGSLKTFGTGLSQGSITSRESVLFTHTLTPGATHGVITHWWITGGASTDYAIISYHSRAMVGCDDDAQIYIDGETTASISFVPSMACGVGFNDDTQSPWSTKWFSKESHSGAWSSKFRIPFQKSVNVTYRAGPGQPNDVIYMIVRGTENLPITIGGFTLPTTARMNLQVVSGTFAPLQWVPVLDLPSGQGMLFHHTLSFSAGNPNTLEGCYHLLSPYNTSFPGLIVSTGTEDYYDSSYYFDGGKYIGETTGLTHVFTNSSLTTLSAYRFHDQDPIFFSGGAQFLWRNGDVTDPATGLKCTSQTGNTVGSPTAAQVLTYTWFYTW